VIGATQTVLHDSTDDWTFRTADTKEITHGIHSYPAMMIPQVARKLIQIFGHKGDVLLDPYCGSGTTLLEGMLAGMNAVGTDLNPLARLIARVKTTPINIRVLDKEIARFPPRRKKLTMPEITNVDYWFAPTVQRDLAAIRNHIDDIGNPAVADAFRVAFSLTIRKSSWTRKGEFKLYRMPDAQIGRHDAEPFPLMRDALAGVRTALLSLTRAVSSPRLPPAVHKFNTVEGVPLSALRPHSVDLVVTSPPYGDSRTTVAYGQFSRLSLQWLGYANAGCVDNLLMGGGKSSVAKFGVQKLDAVISRIKSACPDRASEVAAFFEDYRASIGNVASLVKPGGYICYVVGDRTVKACKVPTSDATAAFFEAHGFQTVAKPQRDIPNKRMPSVNSPSNIPGDVGKTMATEHIVICRKAG